MPAVFSNLHDAVLSGWQIYDKTASGYAIRFKSRDGWVFAEVLLT